MANLKSLAKETAIYGLSSIIGRFLNYLLVPLYTAKLSAASGGYGVITNVYALTAFMLVLLTYGMETGFFRFANKPGLNPTRVYSTILISVFSTSLLFFLLIFGNLNSVAGFLDYADHPEYIGIMAAVVALDAFQSIPFAWLRYQKKAIKFACLKLLFIVMSIGLNLLYFVLLPSLYESHPEWVSHFYNPSVGVGYAFGINLVCTASITLFLWPELTGFRYVFDYRLWRQILSYSLPILILGLAGILNQTVDKIIFPFVYKGTEQAARAQLGIYGAASKIAMIMAMLIQAFRFAYEPFVFGKSAEKDNRDTYAMAMKYFIIFALMAFLAVMCYMDLLRHIIAPSYWEGLRVVPIVMLAEIFMGIYFNLSFWYKLTDKTHYGAWFSLAGCIVIVLINTLLVPQYGYMACAWAGVAGYGVCMLLSYFIGQQKYPIHYDLRSIGRYASLAAILYILSTLVPSGWNIFLRLGINTLWMGIFVVYTVKKDFPLSQLPVIGKWFR
ncbi:MAG: polysaccharide biosynthesis C-terminal domain-containing protein [Bacteroidaceae bacterium]|nr:polysaccharide biosynthesis C-terminal domain-containing protein [Bacteroidaceae bacterium]